MEARRRPVLKLGVVDLGVETATLPNGVTVDLAIVRHPGACAMVALYDDGTIAMLRQYRHAIGGYLIEVPAGCRDAGETPRQQPAACRYYEVQSCRFVSWDAVD